MAYDEDFFAWTQAQAVLLREGAWHELDMANLAEEIESLGRSDRRAVRSSLKVLVMHLLKWQYQPSGRLTGYSWHNSIAQARDEMAMLFEDSPGLRRQVAGWLTQDYPRARQTASDQTHLLLATFPATCPWTAEQVLDNDFWPET